MVDNRFQPETPPQYVVISFSFAATPTKYGSRTFQPNTFPYHPLWRASPQAKTGTKTKFEGRSEPKASAVPNNFVTPVYLTLFCNYSIIKENGDFNEIYVI